MKLLRSHAIEYISLQSNVTIKITHDRNTKKYKLNERLLLKTRIYIKHIINEYKKYKRLKIRNDK